MSRRRAAALLALLFAASPASAQVSRRMAIHGTLDTRTAYAGSWGYAAGGREYALVGEQSGTMVVDITDPNAPVEAAFVPGPASPWREVKTWSHYAYIVSEGTGAGAGMQIVDLAALPATATLVETYKQNFLTAHTLWIDDYGFLIGRILVTH